MPEPLAVAPSTHGSSPKRIKLMNQTLGTSSSQVSVPGPGTSLEIPARKPFSVKVIGKDKAEYSVEIFMRDSTTILNKKDKATKSDLPCPIIYDKNGKANAIIPANHKIVIRCRRTALIPSQRIPRGSYVLFKFFVDGEALSDGVLHEASVKEPDIHGAKARIDTHSVKDDQTVEEADQANPFIGTFVVKVFTKLEKTTVTQGFQALPEDDRVHETTKRRICCAVDMDSSVSGARKVEEYEPTPGMVEVGEPEAVVFVNYDDLVGTRSRHLYEKAFQIDKMREAGVSEAMLREAFPGGVPVAIADGTVINLDDDDIKEEKIDIKAENIDIKEENIDVKEENIVVKEEDIVVKDEKVDLEEEKSKNLDLKNDMECPLCLVEMKPPTRIFQCTNGHVFCGGCNEKMKLVTCPTCIEAKIMGRAIAMEKLASTLYRQ